MELGFYPALGWQTCAVGMANEAERGKEWSSRSQSAPNVKGCQVRIEELEQFPDVTRHIFFGNSGESDKSGLWMR